MFLEGTYFQRSSEFMFQSDAVLGSLRNAQMQEVNF